ncbi:MAG: hypothetical protein EKK34_12600 [Mycobacterium sp.]|nr:MAG: hypothetical protein EKK34_12600 [Mycobacterium sp.]
MVGVAMVAVLLFITAAGVYVGSVVVARHRAQAAADLGALAGAAALPQGVSVACARARAVMREMKVVGAGCEVDGLDLIVTAEIDVTFGVARAGARAGPVGSTGRSFLVLPGSGPRVRRATRRSSSSKILRRPPLRQSANAARSSRRRSRVPAPPG